MRRTSQPAEVQTIWPEVPEYELVRLTKLGNIQAFEELVSRTRDVCLRVASSILRCREDARDEVQNAFWLAYSRIDLFTYQSKFSTWLTRIVINCCFLRLRTCQRRPVVASQVATNDGGWYSYEAVTSETPESHLSRWEMSQALRCELRRIPALLRIPIELHYINEIPIKDVANQLGLTVPAVKSRLHRGHVFLRGRMLKHAPRSGPVTLSAVE